MSTKSKADNQNIQVFVRVRPTNAATEKSRSVVDIKSDKEVSVQDSKQSNTFKTFSFNNVFGPKSAQIDVYRAVVQPLIEEVLAGYNCTVFAYGQTGTGKTFTMEGERSTQANVSWENDPMAGIVPRTLSQLFDELRLLQVDFCVKVSFLELYNEELIDLLSPEYDTSKLRIFEDSTKKGSVIISGLEEVAVHSKADVYQILQKGSNKRQTAATLMNAHSSRSHTVFSVTVHIKESSDGEDIMRTGKINLVDLAGSENIGRSGALDKRAREAGNINQSLLTLGRVITALVDHSPYIPYRDSKLTRILQESLGGCTKTSIIATISPTLSNLEETLSTLVYAHRAKNIQNKPQINQRFCKKTLLKEYSAEIERLQRDLEATRQRTGIYLDQCEYDEMILRLDQLENDVKNKGLQMEALKEELEKKQAICDELKAQSKAMDETLEERTAVLDSKYTQFSKLKSETSEVVNEIYETDHLMLCHLETQHQLTAQADTLRKKAADSITDLQLLHDKIDRTRKASQKNEEKIEGFEKQSFQIINDTKDLINANINCVQEAASSLASATNAKLFEIVQQMDNANDIIEGLSEVACKNNFMSESIVILNNQDDAMYGNLENQKSQFLFKSSDCKAEISLQVMQNHQELRTALSNMDQLIDEFQLGLEINCGTINEVSQDWSTTMPHLLSDTVESVSKKIDSSVKTLDEYVERKDTFHQKYITLQEKAKDKFDGILKLASELENVLDECDNLVESHFNSTNKDVVSMTTVMEDIRASVIVSKETHQSQIDQVECKLVEQIDRLPEYISSSLGVLDFNLQLLPIENILQQSQIYRDAWLLFEKTIREEMERNTTQYQQMFSSCLARAEEINNDVAASEECLRENINQQISLFEKMKTRVLEGKRDLSGIMESLKSPVFEKVEDFQNAVDDVQSFGAKAATPTGKTPQRPDLRIPRDLAATSPHDRILSRLRHKYQDILKFSPENSHDSVYSDADSDLSVSEGEAMVIKEKENTTHTDKVTARKQISSLLPKMRKPLSENN